MALTAYSLTGRRRLPGDQVASVPDVLPKSPAQAGGIYLGQFDSYRVVACCAVVLQHSLLWNVTAGNTTAWAFVMLLHFSRTAFFFLTAFMLTYAEIHRPRSATAFWRRRYLEIGIPYLVWTGTYWVFTMVVAGSWGQAGSQLWSDLVFGYYQLYFVVVLLQLYLVFPLLLRLLPRFSPPRRRHGGERSVRPGPRRRPALHAVLRLRRGRHSVDRVGLALGPGPDHLPGAVRGGGPARPAL